MRDYSKYYYKHPMTPQSGPKKQLIDSNRIYPVLNAEHLMASKERTRVLHQIRTQSGAPVEYFNILYKKLIDNFAEFTQNLPSLKNYRVCQLDRQLNKASIALSLREPYVLAGELLNRTTNEEKALWNYVVFSSILLSQIGTFLTDYRISMVDEKGIFERVWEPLLGSMINQGQHYKIRNILDNPSLTTNDMTVLIARQLMPADGFHWICSNPAALEQWLIGIQKDGDDESGGLIAECYAVLQKYLIANQKLVDQQTQEQLELYLEELLENYLKDHESFDSFPPMLSSNPVETQAGEAFYQWLREGIDQDKISVNQHDSAVLVTNQGVLLLHPEIFDKFAHENPHFHDSKKVFQQFKQLGLVANKNVDSYVAKLPGTAEHQVKGVLLSDPSTLLGKKKFTELTMRLLETNATFRMGRVAQQTRSYLTEKRQDDAIHKTKLTEQVKKEFDKTQYPQIRFAHQDALNKVTYTNIPPRTGY